MMDDTSTFQPQKCQSYHFDLANKVVGNQEEQKKIEDFGDGGAEEGLAGMGSFAGRRNIHVCLSIGWLVKQTDISSCYDDDDRWAHHDSGGVFGWPTSSITCHHPSHRK